MPSQSQIDYQRVERAIGFMAARFPQNPSLDEVAAAVHVSPYHFQRMFTRWAGVSPKKFQQYMALGQARHALATQQVSLLDAAWDAGLSGGGRLHDIFVKIESMTPGTFKQGGAGLTITYDFADSPFGRMIIAATDRGICHMAFDADEAGALAGLQARFPQAKLIARQSVAGGAGLSGTGGLHESAMAAFDADWSCLPSIRLHLHGSPFQIKVWEALLRIPMGRLVSYGEVACAIGRPSAARAVGTAIAANPVAFLIPCHRVIRNTGEIGGYMWGPARKQAIIAWEAVRMSAKDVT